MTRTRQPKKKTSKKGAAHKPIAMGIRKSRNTAKAVQTTPVPKDNRHEIRHILAERVTSDGTYFLTDWYPSWQTQGNMKRASDMLKEWGEHKDEDAFTHKGDIVLKSTNSTQDENDDRVRQMLESTADCFFAYIDCGKTGSQNVSPEDMATRLFIEKDWALVNGQEGAACDVAKDNN
jgi:hypothetical protein